MRLVARSLARPRNQMKDCNLCCSSAYFTAAITIIIVQQSTESSECMDSTIAYCGDDALAYQRTKTNRFSSLVVIVVVVDYITKLFT